jgi:polyisoprenyl-phosphate glycosyltransferase
VKTLNVVCPVYNEEEVIELFYQELRKVLLGLNASYETKIIFVVDPGEDETLNILKRIAQTDSSVVIIALSARFGHQMSLLAGIDHCNSDAVIMMDSDLQHPPSLIPQMVQRFEEGYDIVYTLRQDSLEINFFKRTSSKLFYRLINFISDIPINENAADFRLISHRVVEVFQRQIRERNQFLRGLVGWVGFRSTAISFQVDRRRAGESKYSIRRMIRFGIDGVISFSKSPLQAAVLVGFVFALFGFLFALITLMQYFLYGSFPPGWTTLTILLSIFSGTQLVFMGIMGEYIGAIFDEVKGRPHYIVEEKINFINPSNTSAKSPEISKTSALIKN